MSEYQRINGESYIKDTVFMREMRERRSEISALRANHSSEITKLKSEMKVNEQKWENFAEKLYGEKEFSDVKIVCEDKHLAVTR